MTTREPPNPITSDDGALRTTAMTSAVLAAGRAAQLSAAPAADAPPAPDAPPTPDAPPAPLQVPAKTLRRAGVAAEFDVDEGESHAQSRFDDRVPETQEAFGDIAAFFGRHLGHRETLRRRGRRDPCALHPPSPRGRRTPTLIALSP